MINPEANPMISEVQDERTRLVTKHIPSESFGIEIAPWHSPLTPKSAGYNVLILDVFDGPTLRARALDNPTIPNDAVIEDVDIVSSASSIGEEIEKCGLEHRLDYVVCSHVFEHLPNPIKFLQGCAAGLKPGGVVSMVFPDHRACFDFYRPPTRLSEWVAPLLTNLDEPEFASYFDQMERNAEVLGAQYRAGEIGEIHLRPAANISNLYQKWLSDIEEPRMSYLDAHCSVFTPSSFELLIRDIAFLGLAPFEVLEILERGGEIIAHLRYQPHIAFPAAG